VEDAEIQGEKEDHAGDEPGPVPRRDFDRTQHINFYSVPLRGDRHLPDGDQSSKFTQSAAVLATLCQRGVGKKKALDPKLM
jgi:hypothetical protein